MKKETEERVDTLIMTGTIYNYPIFNFIQAEASVRGYLAHQEY
jgi:hypothetical protein